jgi:hypothetical protein
VIYSLSKRRNIFLTIVASIFVNAIPITWILDFIIKDKMLNESFLHIKVIGYLYLLCWWLLPFNIKNNIVEFYKEKFQDSEDGTSQKEQEYIDKIPKQNHWGILTLILGGFSFCFYGKTLVFFNHPIYWLPIISLLIGIFSFTTFDRETEDNPWGFYLGLTMALSGLLFYLTGFEFILVY